MTTTPALPADPCSLEGPCGFCATLTPAARVALAESLTATASAADEAYAEVLKATFRSLEQSPSASFGDSWGRGLRAGFEISLQRLVDFAPTGTPTHVLSAARAALAESAARL